MDIKEIARRIRKTNNSYMLSMSPDIAVEFATALLAEIQKQNEPVAWRLTRGLPTVINLPKLPEQYNEAHWEPLFTFPPSVEVIENKVAEAVAILVAEEFEERRCAEAIRSGEWRKYMKGE